MPEERMQTGRGSKPVVENPRLPRMTDEPPEETLFGGKRRLMKAKPKADTGKTERMAPVVEGHRRGSRSPTPRWSLGGRGGRPAAGTATCGCGCGSPRAAAYGSSGPRPWRARSWTRSSRGRWPTRSPWPASGSRPADPRRGRAPFLPRSGRDGPGDAGPPRGAGCRRTRSTSASRRRRSPRRSCRTSRSRFFRIKDDLPDAAPALAAERGIGEQFERELREVGRLKGIKPDTLAKPVADMLKEAFR